MWAAGVNNEGIASSLHISPTTVQRRTEEVLKVFFKLKADSPAEVAALLHRAG